MFQLVEECGIKHRCRIWDIIYQAANANGNVVASFELTPESE